MRKKNLILRRRPGQSIVVEAPGYSFNVMVVSIHHEPNAILIAVYGAGVEVRDCEGKLVKLNEPVSVLMGDWLTFRLPKLPVFEMVYENRQARGAGLVFKADPMFRFRRSELPPLAQRVAKGDEIPAQAS